ncbi:MAG: dTMP kinase [Actinomycetota bacterium]|nr:dTMP kinase [Actinomycetota bacterium]
MSPARLITIEGIDGAGKTTLAVALEAELANRGIDIRLLREPGGVPAAERLRELVKDPSLRVGARAEALIYAAARAQLVEEALAPLLESGVWVLLDRFVNSSLAYQGAGRELGVPAVRAINEFATGGLEPDRTLLLTLVPEVARERTQGRTEVVDRLERERSEFFETVARAYDDLWAAHQDRIKKIDASQTPERVFAAALEAIADLL